MSKDPFNYHRIQPRFILGSIPYAPEHIVLLAAQHNVRAILSLTRRNITCFDGIEEEMRQRDIHHFHCPIPDGGIPTPTQQALIHGFLDYRHIPDTATTYIHCRGGVGRSGVVMLMYFHFLRWELVAAREVVAQRHNLANIHAGPITASQRAFLETLYGQSEVDW